MPIAGGSGGPWTAETHNALYPGNLNGGLVQFIVRYIRPKNFMEFGCGVAVLANAVANACELTDSYAIEPTVSVSVQHERNLHLLNVDILSAPPPPELDQKFDLVLSIEVVEHIERSKHELVFDFLSARAGRWVVFSGARPGQGGHGHIAERPESEWRDELVSRGFAFDARMTALARTLCDGKNINHRQNLQVFRAPEDRAGTDALEARAKPHLAELLHRIRQSGGSLAPNPFFSGLQDAIAGRPAFSARWQRENLASLADKASSVLVMGFDAGHAALLFLLANPNARVSCMGSMNQPHSRACFDYLAQSFGDRIALFAEDAVATLPQLPSGRFDLAYVGETATATIASTREALRRVLKDDHVLVIDERDGQGDPTVGAGESAGGLETAPFAFANARSLRSRRNPTFARFAEEPEARVDRTLATMGAIFKDSALASIYLVRGPDGQCLGRARAAALISAARRVEAAGLGGAFVEVGVAGGHSSVIAALTTSRFIPRDFYLFDTFCGFLDPPDEKDVQGKSIRSYDLSRYRGPDCDSRRVRARMYQAGVPEDRLFIVEGRAEARVADYAPERIAILRLDASLFLPTLASLETMYDRLETGGWLIASDYGHWQGCREAIDTFFSKRGRTFAATAVDQACYVHQKVG
jgi:O-methyltransferase